MKYLRRFMWFWTVKLFWVCVISALMTVTFYLSMNVTNIIILVKDGMAARAQVILRMEPNAEELGKFFSSEYLARDATLQRSLAGDSVYVDYDIRGLDHRLSLEWMWSWPWEETASATVVESVPAIDGKIKSSLREAALAQDETRLYPPAWGNARYRVTLVREEGRWKIASLHLLETWKE